MQDSLEPFIVRINGAILYHASVSKFIHTLKEFILQSEIEKQTIREAIESVFRKHPEKILAKSVLVSYTLTELNIQPENYMSLRAKILLYLKNNSIGNDSKFIVITGKKGGVSLRN